MGREAVCTAVIDGAPVGEGKLHLDTDEIVFRGATRLRVKLAEVCHAEARGETLSIRHTSDEAAFAIGAKAAERWAESIRNPPTRLDKFGVAAGMKVVLLHLTDADFAVELGVRAGTVATSRRARGTAMVICGLDAPAHLGRIAGLERLIAPNGAVWIVYPKGRTDIREADVRAASKSAGLVDTKTLRFSATHTGLRFVIPRARR